MPDNILVTSYQNPDLDGTACAFAYAEFLQKAGKKAMAGIFGEPHREAQFVIKRFKIPSIINAEKIIETAAQIILVDSSGRRGISNQIDPNKVVEIIDHRKINEAHEFPKATVQIELVGSASTLIAEKFYSQKIPLSKESAALLFSAIISNTVNFKAGVTMERDHQMADWLKTKVEIPKTYVSEMFEYKSRFVKSIKETIDDDFATFTFNDYHLGIAQLEIVKVDSFVKEKLTELRLILKEIQKEKKLDLIFLTLIDLEKAFNKLIVIDSKMEKILVMALEVKFENGIAKRDGILMRKQIVPLVKAVLESADFSQ